MYQADNLYVEITEKEKQLLEELKQNLLNSMFIDVNAIPKYHVLERIMQYTMVVVDEQTKSK